MASEKTSNINQRYFFNAIISILIMVLFRYIPAFGEMTPLGMELTGVFIGALWGWINCDMVWPSVLAFIFVGFSDYASSASALISTAFGNGLVQLIIWLFVFAAILTVSGISEQLANRLIALKITQGHPWILSSIIIAASFITAALNAPFAGIIICWEFVYMISKQAGYTNKDSWPKMMIVGIVFASAIGLVVLPFTVGVVASYSYLASASSGLFATYDFLRYLIFALLLGSCITAIFMFLCRFVVRPDVTKLKNVQIEAESQPPVTLKQKIAIGSLFLLFAVTILPSLMPENIKTFMNTIGTTGFTLAICAFVTVFRDKEGNPYFSFQELANKGLYWNMVFMVATAVTMGTALSTGDTGFNATFVNMFMPVLSGTNAYFFALIISVVTVILTNLINNAVTCAIMVPLMYSFSIKIGANPLLMTALIVMISNIGLLLPSSSPFGALLAGNKDWVSTKDIVLQSLIGILAALIGVALIGIPLGNILFQY